MQHPLFCAQHDWSVDVQLVVKFIEHVHVVRELVWLLACAHVV